MKNETLLTILSIKFFHFLLVLYIWKSLKNTGPDEVGGRSGNTKSKLNALRHFSIKAFITGIRNEYSSGLPTGMKRKIAIAIINYNDL